MIRELSVENIAIIEQSSLVLEPGLTALTGETGAGKSLLVDAIGLALGDRADTELVRSGAASGSVVLVADLNQAKAARAACDQLGIDLEDGILHVRRDVLAEGRSSCRIGGKPAPVSSLKAVAKLLVDLHGQHDHQALLDPGTHMDYLDAWIGAPVLERLNRMAVIFGGLEDARRRLAALRTGIREREQRIDLLRYQIREITEAGLRLGEVAELQARLKRFQAAERLSLAAHEALDHLLGDGYGATERLGAAVRRAEAIEALDPSEAETAEALRQALAHAEDATRALGRYVEGLDFSAEQVEQTAERLDQLNRLLRKYGDREEQVLEFLAQAEAELALLDDAEQSESRAESEVQKAEAEAAAMAAQLSELRGSKMGGFSAAVQAELRELAMEKARLEVRLQRGPLGSKGTDDVAFLFSANPGEPLRSLDKIASGGEVSRLMLALKVVLSGKAGVPSLIFDEVDTGLSGKAAASVARKLAELGRHYQVVVISHLPQIASQADQHYRIEKVESSGRVVTRVRRLEDDERVDEIARMLAGETIGASARANARELLGWATNG